MTVTSTTSRVVRLLIDRTAIADTLHRYVDGLDQADAELLASSLTENAVVDLGPATEKIGYPSAPLSPRDVAVTSLIGSIGPLDTSHSVSNMRIDVCGDTATVSCDAHVQTSLAGECARAEHPRHALTLNRYKASAVRDGSQWRMNRLTVDNAWFEGDPAILRATA